MTLELQTQPRPCQDEQSAPSVAVASGYSAIGPSLISVTLTDSVAQAVVVDARTKAMLASEAGNVESMLRRVQAVLIRRGLGSEVAEDIVHDAYCRLIDPDKGPKDPVLNLEALLMRTAMNLGKNHVRAKHIHRTVNAGADENRQLFDSLASHRSGDDPTARLERLERSEGVARALAKLRADHRSYLIRFYQEDATLRDLGADAGKTPEMMKWHLYKARKEFQKALEEDELFEELVK